MFKITEAGRARVRTQQFCDELVAFVIEADANHMNEDAGDAGMVVQVALALADLDYKILSQLSEAEFDDLGRFVNENFEEILNALIYCQDFSVSRCQRIRDLRSRAGEIWPSLKQKENL